MPRSSGVSRHRPLRRWRANILPVPKEYAKAPLVLIATLVQMVVQCQRSVGSHRLAVEAWFTVRRRSDLNMTRPRGRPVRSGNRQAAALWHAGVEGRKQCARAFITRLAALPEPIRPSGTRVEQCRKKKLCRRKQAHSAGRKSRLAAIVKLMHER